MKREERLHRLLGGIEDELIEDAAQPTALLYVWLPRLAAVAAAVVLTVGIALGPWWEQTPPPVTPPTSDDVSQGSTTTSATTTQTTTHTEDSSATEDSTTTEQTTTSSTVTVTDTTISDNTTDHKTTHITGSKTNVTDNAGTVSKSALKTTTKGGSKSTVKSTVKTTTKSAGKTTTKTTTKSTEKSTTKTTVKSTAAILSTTTAKSTTKTTWKHGNKTTTGKSTIKSTATTKGTTLPWSGTDIIDVFPTFRWNTPTSLYQVKKIPVNRSELSSHITDITVSGHDGNTNTDHTITARLSYIGGIHMSAAVAVRYGSESTYFVAVNKEYRPVTLGKLVNDLCLAEHLEVGTIRYTYTDEENNLHEATCTGLTTETLCELLLSDASLFNIYEENMTFSDTINVSISLPVLDEYGILTVSKDGYLYTDLLSSGKAFYIGEETASAFWDYVQNHCTQTSVE